MIWVEDSPDEHLTPGTYWITRDSSPEGVLEPICDIWDTPPIRIKFDSSNNHCWITDVDSTINLVVRTSLEYVRKRFGVVPDTDRECLRVVI